MITWLASSLEQAAAGGISLDVRHAGTDTLEATLISPLRIGDTGYGVRKFAVLGIERPGGEVRRADVERFCLESASQFGVVEAFVLFTGLLDAEAKRLLGEHRVRDVTVLDDPAGLGPTPEAVAGLGRLLLGALWVRQFAEDLGELTAEARAAGPADAAEEYLRGAYLLLALLYLSEGELLTGLRSRRTQGLQSQSGARSCLLPGYGFLSETVGGRARDYYLPAPSHLKFGVDTAGNAYNTALHVDRSGPHGKTASFLLDLSRLFLDYYLTWRDGHVCELACEPLRAAFPDFLQAQHVALISGRLRHFQPADQVYYLDLLRQLGAKGAAPDIIDLLGQSPPRVQEECLRTLGSLGLVPDLPVLEEFLVSPREAVRDSALAVVGQARGPEAARYLIGLVNAGKISISVPFLNAIAQTRSVLALGSLLHFGAGREQIEQPVLDAIESCLDALTPEQLAREPGRYVHGPTFRPYAVRLFESGQVAAMRLAVKLVAALRDPAGELLIERALADEGLLVRLAATRAVARFPTDRLVRALVASLEDEPEDYERKKLIEWMTANISVQHGRDGPAGAIASVADLDLRRATLEALREADTEAARAHLAALSGPSEPQPAADEPGPHDGDWIRDNVVRKNSVFESDDRGTLWVQHHSAERKPNDVAMACLYHDNRFDSQMSLGEAASMLSSGASITQGTEKEIFEDVVWPFLCGERPRFPLAVGMGEFKLTRVEGDRTVVESSRDLDGPGAADDGAQE